ncbi:hypothetical protein GW17_00022256, partial [Ensete ventricosum]
PPLRAGAIPEEGTSVGAHPAGVAPIGGCPLRTGCRRPWPCAVGPEGALAAACCPYRRPGHGWPPLQVAWSWVATPPRCREGEEYEG